MERLLNDQIVKQIEGAFHQLKQPVQMLFFGSGKDCEYCADARQLLEEVAAVNDKISLKIYDIQTDKDIAEKYNVDKFPAIVIAAKDSEQISNLGIQFSGVPSGHEFSMLVNDLLLVSNRDSGLSPAVREFLKNLSQPVLLQVFVTPT
ncbi:MAG TPA: thioredoxin family protein [Anaerolineales bacterium]|nr:thioredoxin family protein [Anaerolineales bacterium]